MSLNRSPNLQRIIASPRVLTFKNMVRIFCLEVHELKTRAAHAFVISHGLGSLGNNRTTARNCYSHNDNGECYMIENLILTNSNAFHGQTGAHSRSSSSVDKQRMRSRSHSMRRSHNKKPKRGPATNQSLCRA